MSSPIAVDTLINARWVLPIVPAGKVFEHCSVVINHGEIIAIVPSEHAAARFSAKETHNLTHHAVMPGLINAHGHAAMSLFRGFADDLPLHTWLGEHIWPAEAKWVTPDFVADGTYLALAEMLATGTTCFSDMYFYPEETAKVTQTLGMRAQITFPILDFPTAWAADADEYIHKGLALHDDYRASELITIGFGPHAPYTVSDAPLKRIATLAEELQTPIHIHLHETAEEIEQAIANTGKRPIQRLADLNVLSPLTQCVHMTQITSLDIALLQQTGASVIHCPQSNLKLASGLCPTQALIDAGIRVGLGTDGAASNNGLSLWAELNVAALIGKVTANNAAAISAHTALHMATLGGAMALGLDKNIGSLEQGKKADLIAVQIKGTGAEPLYDIASHLVYNNRNLQVSHTWVNGKCLFADGNFTQLNLASIHSKARQWRAKIQPTH